MTELVSTRLVVIILGLAALVAQGSPRQRPGRIVHGQPAKKGELRYQASVQIGFGGGAVSGENVMRYSPFCGGTMINKEWVITAAHCAVGRTPDELQVVLGAFKLNDPKDPAFKVSKIIVHQYDKQTKRGDLALLKIEPVRELTPDELKEYQFEPIALPDPSFNPEHKKCIVSGWGLLKHNGEANDMPNELQEAEVMVLSAETCAKIFLKDNYPWDDKNKTMICAGGKDKDACQGDSGGPLVCKNDDGVRVLSGIVSWGIGCATEGEPGVYTNVARFSNWIHFAMKNPDKANTRYF